MSSDTVLARIELASNDTVLAEWSSDLLANLANCAIGIDCMN
jgi:hypothetical protein